MWSGTTLTNYSGSVIGAHQKIDRVARRNLELLTQKKNEKFPYIKHILHFEGKNGPDGIKSKSPAKDEPWHFYDPFDPEDTKLIQLMSGHYDELVWQLKKGSPERAAFDAAWLAHTIVDGLTPAHHFPYEEKLEEIRGDSMDTRDSIMSKVIMPGDTIAEKLRSNWQMYGFGGLMSMHGFFEIGVGFLLAPIKMKTAKPSQKDIDELTQLGYEEIFKRAAREIALLDMYDRFHEKGWSVKLSRDVRNHLGPIMAKTVCLIWYSAMRDAGLLKGKK